MPIFTPSRRWQPAFYPFKKRHFSQQAEETLERSLKGVLWGCRMCGNCLLQETAFICPMACPKGLRNGPCGGSTPDHCCVDESRPCIWYAIFMRADKMGRLEKLLEILPPLDWDKTGTSALRDVYEKFIDHGIWKSFFTFVQSPNEMRKNQWDGFFREIRQPDWWAADSHPHTPSALEPVSKLERILTSGKFALTCEVVPPVSGDFSTFDLNMQKLAGVVDAVNITDGASALPRTSSFACSIRATENGVEPVLQMTARDRTRISFQAELLGASASGIRNLLLITGDHPNKGAHPFSKMDIWDFDSIQALWIARKLRDDGIMLDGRKVENQPRYFLGAAAAPFASQPKYQAIRTEKKVNAGAKFLQTNLVFDIPRFRDYLEALDQRNLLNRVHLLAGIAPIRSLNMLEYIQQLPGVQIPDKIFDRLKNTKDIQQESHQINLSLIEQVRSIPGVQGIHFMAISNIGNLRRLITESGLK
jgi:5,10-methylenetetrahydrofolate reductase